MSEPITIKAYSSDDQTQILELILHIQQDEYHIPITKADQPDLLNIETFYQTGNGNFWAALSGDHVVGTVALLDIGNHQAALRKMFVAKDYRGKTFNTAGILLNRVFEWAKQKAVHEIFLGTTLEFVAAHRFYEKNGFQNILPEELPGNFPIMQVDKKFYKFQVARGI